MTSPKHRGRYGYGYGYGIEISNGMHFAAIVCGVTFGFCLNVDTSYICKRTPHPPLYAKFCLNAKFAFLCGNSWQSLSRLRRQLPLHKESLWHAPELVLTQIGRTSRLKWRGAVVVGTPSLSKFCLNADGVLRNDRLSFPTDNILFPSRSRGGYHPPNTTDEHPISTAKLYRSFC